MVAITLVCLFIAKSSYAYKEGLKYNKSKHDLKGPREEKCSSAITGVSLAAKVAERIRRFEVQVRWPKHD